MNRIYPDSSSIKSVYIPSYFDPVRLSLKAGSLKIEDDVVFDYDAAGKLSIIKLNRFPFIDFSYYDNERRTWFHSDKDGVRYRVYSTGEHIIETNSIHDGLEQIAISPEINISSNLNKINITPNNLKKYQPITISLNGVDIVDITDYMSYTNTPILNDINPDTNPEFYYNSNGIIYTNINLIAYDIRNIDISYLSTVDKLNVHCRMNTNTPIVSDKTPLVDYYVLKLIGQEMK